MRTVVPRQIVGCAEVDTLAAGATAVTVPPVVTWEMEPSDSTDSNDPALR